MGDEIIYRSIKKNLPWLFKDNYIFELPTHTPMYHIYQQLLYKHRMDVYRNADYKFLLGTNALYTNMIRPLPVWNISLFNSSLIRGTVCLGVGSGVNSKHINGYTKALYNRVLSHDFFHSVRDEKTKVMLEGMGFKAINTGCPTLWGISQESANAIPDKKSDETIFTLTCNQGDAIRDKYMIDCLLMNYRKVYFWPQNIGDLEYMKSLCDSKLIGIIPPNVDAYDYFLTNMNVDYVGNRLHGGIFALQHRRRTIIISIDHRADNIRESYSIPCIKREALETQLESRINSDWKTNIQGISTTKIKQWSDQFR